MMQIHLGQADQGGTMVANTKVVYPIQADKFAIPFAVHRGIDNTANLIIKTYISSLSYFEFDVSSSAGANGNWFAICI